MPSGYLGAAFMARRYPANRFVDFVAGRRNEGWLFDWAETGAPGLSAGWRWCSWCL
ncbi:protein of unknown function [Hyphomicrobium sp. 1Nfss2.1]